MESGGSIINLRVPMLSTAGALGLVLRFRGRDRLPLHVARRVCAAARERFDVVDDVARTTVRIAALRFIRTETLWCNARAAA